MIGQGLSRFDTESEAPEQADWEQRWQRGFYGEAIEGDRWEYKMEEDAEVLREILAYKSVLPGAFRAAHMADGDPEYLAVAGGAMAVLTPP